MVLNNPLFERLSSIQDNAFNVYLPTITLKKEGKLIEGSGHLYHDKGKIILKIINAFPPSKEEESFNFLTSLNNESGIEKIRYISKYCYVMTARDEDGNRYECKYVDVGKDFDRMIYTCEFKSALIIKSEIESEIINNHASIVFKNKYNFATNDQAFQDIKFATFLEGTGSWKGIWKLEVDGLMLILHKATKFLHLDIQSSNQNIDKNVIKRIINSLDFVMGIEHQYFYWVVFNQENLYQVQISTNSKTLQESTFSAPYRRTEYIGDETTENTKLFISYYTHLKFNSNTLFPKLHARLFDSGTGYYYKHGLVVSVIIEKILKDYYPIPFKVEKIPTQVLIDFEGLKSHAIDLITKTLIDQLGKFIKSLTPVPEYNPNKMLQQLEKNNVIGPGSLKSWKSLRHKYTHGDDYNDNMQKAIGLIRHNQTIYYELIFNIIGYDGKYTSYSDKEGIKLKIYQPRKTPIF